MKVIQLILLTCIGYQINSTPSADESAANDPELRNTRQINDEKAKISNLLGSTLTKWFRETTDYSQLTDGIRGTLRSKVNVQKVHIDNLVSEFKADMEQLLKTKLEALRDLTMKAEDIASKYTYSDQFMIEDVHYLNLKTMKLPENETRQKFLWETGVHIPVEVYHGDNSVLRDLNWTGSDELNEAFKGNLQHDSTIFRQYIATETGISRIFPAYPWRVEPPDITIDLFDPRFRPWYTSAVTDPKDVLFLLDYSGSVHGRTLRLMKLTVLTILTALNENDYIHAVWFNDMVGPFLKNCFETFMPASSRNKILLQKWFDKVEDHQEANVPQALNYTFQEFQKFWNDIEEKRELQYGSGGHQMIIILTDKVERWGESVFEEFVPRDADGKPDAKIRIFGLGMGFGTNDIAALQWMSCTNKGAYTLINTLPEVKAHSRKFIPVLSRPLALSLMNMTVEERSIKWTGPYMDAQAAGPVVTVSMPIMNTMFNGTNASFVGVAGIDIKLSAMSSLIDTNELGPQAYVFAVDNNGQILVHPDHKFPEPDLQMVRRTACFKAGPVSKRGNNRVLFNTADESIVRQMGLMDSVDQYDLLEIEPDIPSVRELRKHMIDQSCDNKIYIAEAEETKDGVAKQYTCRSFKDLGISVGIASTVNPTTAKFYDYRNIKDLWALKYADPASKVGGFMAPVIVCNGQIDLATAMSRKRYDVFLDTWQNGVCEMEPDDQNPTTKRMLANLEATIAWRDKFGLLETNVTCKEWVANRTDENFDYLFAQMDGGLTVLYPKCPSAVMLQSVKSTLADSEYRDIASKDIKKYHFIVEEGGVTIVKGISTTDNENFLITVSGIRTSFQHLSNQLLQMSKDSDVRSLLYPCSHAKRCYLVTENDMRTVAATLNDRAFYFNDPKFGFIEPEIFEALHNESRIKQYIFDDYQADCDILTDKYFLSGADSIKSAIINILAYFGNIGSIFGSYIWYFLLPGAYSEIQEADDYYDYDNGNFSGHDRKLIQTTYVHNCEKEKSEMEESCILKRYKYFFSSSHYFDTVIGTGVCERKISSLPVQDTNLVLLIVDATCDNARQMTTLQIAPKRISECDAVKIRYRRRLKNQFVTFHPQETFTCSVQMISTNNIVMLLLLFVIFFRNVCL